MGIEFFKKLSTDYLDLLDDKEDFNVNINIDEASDTKIFKAHSAVLRYRSLYFRNELAKIDKDKDHIKTINLKNITIQQFDVIIKYIYGGMILLDNYDASFIFELMIVACKFLLEELAQYLETHLIEAEPHWLRLHFSRIYQTSFQNNKIMKLQNWCNDIIVKYPEKVFDSDYFDSLQENALVSLIGRDELQMEEVKIWNYVIKWGIAQNPDLPSDPESWSHENFNVLKTSLQNCLPLIRYFQMSSDDIIDNVEPYKRVLEKSLWKDIKKRFMSPNRPITSTILPPRLISAPTLPSRESFSKDIKLSSREVFSEVTTLPSREEFSKVTTLQSQELFSIVTTLPSLNLFSTVISDEHAAKIASWIDNKDDDDDTYSITNNPYDFKLLLRGSQNGFIPETFWNLCNKKKNIIVVIKVEGTDEIIGGYNPIGWDIKLSRGYHTECDDCFIFSLNNDTILSRVKKPECAIYNYPEYGPCFGGNRGRNFDLVMKKDYDLKNNDVFNQCYCKYNSYGKAIRNNTDEKLYFSVEEYEIFQILTKS